MSVATKPVYNLRNDAFLGTNEQFNKKLLMLASMAKEENWNFKSLEYKKSDSEVPILQNYIFFTYDRLKAEKKIAISPDDGSMCFNTGLQTKDYEEDIYAYFLANERFPNESNQKWFFVKFCKQYDSELRIFTTLPEVAEYIENASDLILDKKLLPIRINLKHIIEENKERFSKVGICDDTYVLQQRLENAVKNTEQRVKRNYKVAIPQFFTDRDTNISKIQLLLPLCINNRNIADLALVVEKDQNAYVAKTILPLDWAYMNSRRIVRPDADWISQV